MSIKQFVESMGTSTLYSALPTPFIESVEIHDNRMNVQLSMYVPILKQDYVFDQGASYLETFNDIVIVTQALFDRNSDVESCGVAPYNTTSDFRNLPVNAWTDYLQKNISPLKNMYGHPSDEMYIPSGDFTEVVTQFVFDPDTADFSGLYDYFISGGHSLFQWYDLPAMEGYTTGNGTYGNIIEQAKAICNETRSDCTDNTDELPSVDDLDLDEEIRGLVIYLINQVIAANDYDLIIQLFGHITFQANDYPTPVEVDGLIPNMKLIKLHVNTVPIVAPFSDFAANISDILENEDGSAIVKMTHTYPVLSKDFTPAVYGRQQDLGIKKMGLVAYSAAWENLRNRFTTAIEKEIRGAVSNNDESSLLYWQSTISPSNHVEIVKDNNISFDPAVVYMDENNKIYQQAMRTLDGLYYDPATVPLENVVSSMTAILEQSGVNDNTSLSFRYVLAQALQEPTDILPLINKYRKAFPDKSTVTSEGQFYSAFAENLYNTNKNLKRGTQLKKALISNPIIKDLRTSVYSAGSIGKHVGTSYEQAYYDIFKLENALWSRYTEVTGIDETPDMGWTESYQPLGDATAGMLGLESSDSFGSTALSSWSVDTTYRDGFQWNYNFIDHGFMFFNYERALKTTSQASRYLNLTLYEKYFGAGVLNSLFQMRQCYFGSYWGDPDDVNSVFGADYVAPIGTMLLDMPQIGGSDLTYQTTHFYYTDLETRGLGIDADINVDKFKIVVENNADSFNTVGEVDTYLTGASGAVAYDSSLMMSDTGDPFAFGEYGAAMTDGVRLTSEYGGADGMTKEKEYSFLALRGFSPTTTTEGVNPLLVGETFYTGDPLNYRLACIEFQKCDIFNATEVLDATGVQDWRFHGDLLEEISESTRGGAFRCAMLVKDETDQVILELKDMLQGLWYDFGNYVDAAADKCSFNESTGYFNQYFIDAVKAKWPDSAEAPYFAVAVKLVILEDLFYSTYSGDTSQVVTEVKKIVHSVSPDTGTLPLVNFTMTRIETLLTHIDQIIDKYSAGSDAAGHIYGHQPYFETNYDNVASKFNDEVVHDTTRAIYASGTPQSTAQLHNGAYRPDAEYANYPLFPTKYTLDSTGYTVSTYDEGLLEDIDIADGFNTIVDQLLRDYDLALDIQRAVVDMANDMFAEMEDRIGLDHGGYFDILDILDIFTGTIGSTFPSADDFLNGVIDSYTDPWGNTGMEAASVVAYMADNFTNIASMYGDMFNSLNNMDSGALASMLPELSAGLFGSAGSFKASASVSDYMSSGSSNLALMMSFQPMTQSVMPTKAYSNPSWM